MDSEKQILYPHGRLVDKYIRVWMKRLKNAFDLVEEGRALPVEIALIFQREFIAIHPFSDGNGRTSRFLQDLILKKYGLPPIPSGYLTNEFRTFKKDYIERGYLALEKELGLLENCISEYRKNEVGYDCQIID